MAGFALFSAGLFNLRGSDIEYNPVFFAYSIVGMKTIRYIVFNDSPQTFCLCVSVCLSLTHSLTHIKASAKGYDVNKLQDSNTLYVYKYAYNPFK